MVKLQKHLAYKYKDKHYFKYVVTIPEEDIERLGWQSGTELSWSNTEKALLLQPKEEEDK